MEITQAMLRRVVSNVNNARINEAVAAFNMWMAHYGINTDKKKAHFLSQCFHECNNLNSLEENLNYSADGLRKTFPKYFKTSEEAAAYARKPQQIASRVYANRMGNGNETSGDGWRYRGSLICRRGLCHIPGFRRYHDKSCFG